MNFYIAEPVTRLPLFNFLVRYIFTEVLLVEGNKNSSEHPGKVNFGGNEQKCKHPIKDNLYF